MDVKVIQIKSAIGLANRMCQFMVAKKMQSLVGNLDIRGHNMPEWQLLSQPGQVNARPAPILSRHYFDIHYIADLMNSGKLHGVELQGLGLRLKNFPDREDSSNLFHAPEDTTMGCGEEELLINIRGCEILENLHPDYGPLPIRFYQHIVQCTGLQPVFQGQIEEGHYLDQIRETFPHAKIVPSKGVISDFQMIRKSRNIVSSVSTYTWLASWFSNATQIFLPLLGMFNPRQRPDINLLPVGDPRYRFFLFPIRRWSASPEQFKALHDDSLDFREIRPEEARSLQVRNMWRCVGMAFLKRCQFEVQRLRIHPS